MAISVATVTAIFIIWFAVTNIGIVNPLFLPTPQAVGKAFVDLAVEGYKGQSLLVHVGTSMWRLLVALFFAVVAGIPLGILCGCSKTVHAIVTPILEFYRPLPPLAYYALIVLWLGIGDPSKILLLFLSAFAPLLIGVTFAVQNTSTIRVNSARALGAHGWHLYTGIVLRECLPQILTSFRTALGVAYSTLVAAEMIAATSGLGWLVLDASKYLRNDIVYAGIILMGAIAILLNAIVQCAINASQPWKRRG